MLAAMKASGSNFGIYSFSGGWSDIFGLYGVALDSSLPLWWANYNGDQVCFPPSGVPG
jgi:hypothetical protein